MNKLLIKEKAININRCFIFFALIAIINILVFSVFTLAYADSPAPDYVLQWGTSGDGNGQFCGPYGICSDPQGNIYVADTYNNRIQKFSFPDGGGGEGGGGEEEGKIEITPDISTIMLGEKVTFSATKNGQPIDVGWAICAIDEINSPLFSNSTGMFFDPQTESSSKEFLAVHLGKGEIIAAVAINGGSVVVGSSAAEKEITVVSPAKLGAEHNEMDEIIIEKADKFGIPPQIIKGQIDQESEFNSSSYRYEPSYDRRYVSIRNDIRTRSAYTHYRMEF